MFAVAVSLVLLSGMCHAVWNLFTKKSGNKAVFLWSIAVLPAIGLLPVLIAEWQRVDWPPAAYALAAASLLFQGGYAWAINGAYRYGDMSQVYPIMRGTGTLLVPVISVLFLGGSLSPWGWLGLAAILLGFVLLSGWLTDRGSRPDSLKPILLAFTVGLCITGYTLVDSRLLDYLSPVSLLALSNLGFGLALLPAVVRSKAFGREWRRNWKVLLLGAVLSPGSYLLFLFALTLAAVEQLTPIREVGIVFGTVLGIVVLKEMQGLRRILSSVVIACGIIVIGIWG